MARPFIELPPTLPTSSVGGRESGRRRKSGARAGLPSAGPQFSRSRSLLILGVAVLLLALLSLQVVRPLKGILATRYRNRGDSAFVAFDFDRAQSEYQRALRLVPNNATVQERQRMLAAAPTDIAVAAPFFASHGVGIVGDRLARAQGPFTSVKAAVETGASLYREGLAVYARYPLEQATSQDPQYAEGWHYLSLVYSELAAADASYRERAAEAQARRDALTPVYRVREAAEAAGSQ